MTNLWKVHSLSLATTSGVAYILCAIFDALFPPYGMIAALAAHSPWPLREPAWFLDRVRDVHGRWFRTRRALWNRVGILEQKTAVRRRHRSECLDDDKAHYGVTDKSEPSYE